MHHCYQTRNLMGKPIIKTLLLFFVILFSSPPLTAEENNNAAEVYRSVANYVVPNVAVVRDDGKKLEFIKELDDGRPVIMNFIFASCSAICPMITHVFNKVQSKLETDSQKVHLVSISIDPENDTPTKLSEYAKKFGAGPNWNYYTGTVETSIAIQKAFNAYRGDKMNHASVILMRAAPGKSWLRLDGFMSADTVVAEYRKMTQP